MKNLMVWMSVLVRRGDGGGGEEKSWDFDLFVSVGCLWFD